MGNRIRSRIDTYCEYGFIEYLEESISRMSFSDNLFSENNNSFQILINLFSKESNLFVNTDVVELHRKNTFVKMLYKQGACNLIHIENLTLFEEIGSGISFIKNKTELTKKIPLTFIKDTWKSEIQNLYKVLSYKVDKSGTLNEFMGWDFIRKLNIPINAAIIIDRYAFKYKESVKINILMILKNMIPANFEDEFNLTIITEENESIKYSEIDKLISNGLKDHNRNIKLTLSIYRLNNISETHDRKIITNYYTITSGNSFDYYSQGKDLINVSTRVTFTPILFRNDIHLEVEQIKYLCNKYKAQKPGANRLIDYKYKEL